VENFSPFRGRFLGGTDQARFLLNESEGKPRFIVFWRSTPRAVSMTSLLGAGPHQPRRTSARLSRERPILHIGVVTLFARNWFASSSSSRQGSAILPRSESFVWAQQDGTADFLEIDRIGLRVTPLWVPTLIARKAWPSGFSFLVAVAHRAAVNSCSAALSLCGCSGGGRKGGTTWSCRRSCGNGLYWKPLF